MFDVEQDYTSQIDKLRKLLKSPKNFDLALELALQIHAITHTHLASSSKVATFCDNLLEDLTSEDFSLMPYKNGESIAWHLWHITRIEDAVSNLLIAEQAQVFNSEWMLKLNTQIKDTGNTMTSEQILQLSKDMNKQELINYRNTVACQTRNILKSLTPSDLKRRPSAEYLNKLLTEEVLLEHKKSLWLKDFWGKHTVSGLILLPLTRHHMMHLQDSLAIKQYVKESKKPS